MVLWIRSQDKKILKKCNYIRVHEIIMNEDYVLEDDEIDYGRYTSEERAMAVLNEIENALLLNDKYDYSIPPTISSITTNLIYTMPEK